MILAQYFIVLTVDHWQSLVMSIYVASADGFTFRESWIGSIVVRLYDGVYHAELFTCTPGSFEGIEWTKEELEATRVCLEDSAAWMAERCR